MSDLISRQAAIDVLEERLQASGYSNVALVSELNRSIGYLMRLPSAQPEPIKINIEDFNKEDWERLKKEWGNTPITVLPAQPEIIRCKDCKHWFDIDDGRQKHRMCADVNGDWFCGDAERRTNA